MTKRNSVRVVSVILAALFAAAVFSVGPVSAGYPDDAEYVGASKCKMCHNKADEGEQYKKWSSLSHAKAFETLKSDEAKAAAKEAGLEALPHEAPECLKCHVTAYDVKEKKVPEAIEMELGVQCETCHGPASMHLDDGKAVKFQKADPAEIGLTDHLAKADEAKCRECHNEESPTWDPERYKLEDGSTAGFDFKQAWKKIAHPNPQKAEAK